MSAIVVQNRYNRILQKGLSNFEKSETQQHFAQEVNIHNIIERSKRGMIPIQQSEKAPIFGDFSVVTDYQSALEALAVSEDAFMSLDPIVRKRFNNNPGELMEFITNPDNKKEAIELGLVNPEPPVVEEPLEVLKGIREDLAKGLKTASKDA